jgi:hypothetical protein
MAGYRALREGILRKTPAGVPVPHPACGQVRAALAAAGAVMTEWHARALLDAYGIGGGARTLARSAAEAGTAAKVRVLIESANQYDKWSTVGVSENIIEASWQALVDSINYLMMKKQLAAKSEDDQAE